MKDPGIIVDARGEGQSLDPTIHGINTAIVRIDDE